MERCNARTKAASANGAPPADPGPWAGAGYCKRPAGWGVPEATTGRCRYHGGASLKGAGHPRASHLRDSKHVPKHLAEEYEASLRRDDQLNLDRQIAAIDARLEELMEEMPEGAGPDLWSRTASTFERYERAIRRGQRLPALELQAEIRDLLTGGHEYATAWDGVTHLMELRRRLVATEASRRSALEQNVTRSRLASLVVYLTEGITRAINENVSSEKERRRALTQVSTFVGGLALGPGREPVEIPAEEVR